MSLLAHEGFGMVVCCVWAVRRGLSMLSNAGESVINSVSPQMPLEFLEMDFHEGTKSPDSCMGGSVCDWQSCW